MALITKVNILACEIRKHTGTNRSESMKMAWTMVKATPDCELLVFNKVDGTPAKRVVTKRWYDYHVTAQTNSGTTNTRANGQVLFADLAKVAANKPCIISTYPQNIVTA